MTSKTIPFSLIGLLAIAVPGAALAQSGSTAEQDARRACWTQVLGSSTAKITFRKQFVSIDKCVSAALGYRDPYMRQMEANFPATTAKKR